MKTIKFIFRQTIKVFCLALMPSTIAFGQGFVGSDPGKGSQMSAQPGGIVQEMKLAEPKIIGNSYLFEEWYVGSIMTTSDKVIEGYPIRYDLNHNGIEIKAKDRVKFLSCARIKKFSLTNSLGLLSTFVSPRSAIRSNPKIQDSFLEIIFEGKGSWNLYKQTVAKLVSGNYNAALDMGSRNNKIVKESQYIMGDGNKYYIVDGSRRRFSKNFTNRDEVFSFLKDNRLNLKNEEDLKKLMVFLSEQ